MFQDRVYCVMVNTPIRDDAIHDELFIAAHLMMRAGRSKQKVRGDDFEGQVRTKRDLVALGGITGVEFFATVDTPQSRLEVRYLVRHVDLKDVGNEELGAWFDRHGEYNEVRPSALSRLKKIVQSN